MNDWVRTGGYITIACKGPRRYFDLDAVRTEAQQPEPAGDRSDRRTRGAMALDGKGDRGHHGAHPAGAPPLDWFIGDDEPQTINSEGSDVSLEYRIGDVFQRMAEIPDGSVDLIVTSPPFLALRSYLPADHPDKAKEIGSEATPAEFIDTLLALSAEWGRVLAPHGSLCVELGDTFSGSKAQDDGVTIDWHRPNQYGSATITRTRSAHDKRGAGWPLAKSLTGIPTLYPWSLAYGRNLLTGQPSPAGQWRIRNVIVWARPNPPVGALGDKFRPATSYITVACRGARRYFDLDAVRGPGSPNTHARLAQGVDSRPTNGKKADNPNNNFGSMDEVETAGAPPLDWHTDHHPEDGDWLWKMSTQPYAGSHYATFPMALPKRLIEAMCPLRVCRECGKPSERIVEQAGEYAEHRALARGNDGNQDRLVAGLSRKVGRDVSPGPTRVNANYETLGWSDCGHDQWRTGIVLDPFAGSGTTLEAAQAVGRHAIGIDLDHRNVTLAQQRVGMFMEVDDDARPETHPTGDPVLDLRTASGA
jgi:site-specific DNA-methyltransferase (adenine-specific)